MKDNYFSSYGTTRFIVDNYKKLGRISIITSVCVLSIPVIFGLFSFLGRTVDAYNGLVQQQNSQVLGIEEKTVRAEDEFVEIVAVSKEVTKEERSRAIRKVTSEIHSGDRRVLVLRAFFEAYRCGNGTISPMAEYSKELVEASDKYGLDWRYSTAIAGVETWFGCVGGADTIYKNAWGYGGGPSTRFVYNSWPEGIDAFSKGFAKGYGTKDLDFYRFASYYTRGLPGRNDRWADGVTSYLRGIDRIDAEL